MNNDIKDIIKQVEERRLSANPRSADDLRLGEGLMAVDEVQVIQVSIAAVERLLIVELGPAAEAIGALRDLSKDLAVCYLLNENVLRPGLGLQVFLEH